MYEFKIELAGKPDTIKRNLSKPQAAEMLADAIADWSKTPGRTMRVVTMEDDGAAIIDMYENTNKVGRASAYPLPTPSRPVTGKYKDLQKLMRQGTNAAELATAVTDIATEIIQGRWPGHEKANLVSTVKEFMDTPGFWTSKIIVRDLAASYVGRYTRKAAGMAGLNVDDPLVLQRMLPILASTDQAEKDCIKIVQERIMKKFGTDNHDPVKIKALEAKLIALLPDSEKHL